MVFSNCAQHKQVMAWLALHSVCKNTSASLLGLCMVDASINRGDGMSKCCTLGHLLMSRLAGMKLDNGTSRMGRLPEAKGRTCMHCVCVEPFEKPLEY